MFWLEHRFRQISTWKNNIDALSREIKNLENQVSELKPDLISPSMLEKKGLFLTDFSSIMDEYRNTNRYVKSEKMRLNDRFSAEVPIGGMSLILDPPQERGVISSLLDRILELSGIIKEEYDVLKNQYDLLTEHLSDLLDIGNIKSSLKLAKSNKILQIAISAMTGVLIVLTAILALRP